MFFYLPFDLQGEIFSYLSLDDLYHLSIALKISYKKIFLLGKKHYALRNTIDLIPLVQKHSLIQTCMNHIDALHYILPPLQNFTPKFWIDEWIYYIVILKAMEYNKVFHCFLLIFSVKNVIDWLYQDKLDL